jgi:hypothetical protein
MDDDLKFPIIIGVVVVFIGVIVVLFSANQEARIFNRFSQEKITTWDALWADFRILPKES